MFTGIVKEIGKIERIIKRSTLIQLGVRSTILYQESKPSESIALNGVCLTLTHKEKGLLSFEVVKPTFKITNLKRLTRGTFVNLEPSLTLQDKLGGHFVLGHSDAEVKIKRIGKKRDYWQLEVELPFSFKKYIVNNGSVALEGISLTVKRVFSGSFVVDIIPFTYYNTSLKYKKIGDWLNIEFDYLLKQKAK